MQFLLISSLSRPDSIPLGFSGFILSLGYDKCWRHTTGKSYAKLLAELPSSFASKRVSLSLLEKDISYVLLQLGVAEVRNSPWWRWVGIPEKCFPPVLHYTRVLLEIKTKGAGLQKKIRTFWIKTVSNFKTLFSIPYLAWVPFLYVITRDITDNSRVIQKFHQLSPSPYQLSSLSFTF